MRSRAPSERRERRGSGAVSDHEPRSHPDAAAVLSLQRSAGNAAVASWLGAPGGRVLQRRRPQLPADPTGLGDYAPVRGRIRVDTNIVDLGELEQYHLGGRAGVRAGLTAAVRFSGAMAAATGAQVAPEDEVRDWLANIGMTLFNLHDNAVDPVVAGVTRIEELDLTAHGGQHGRYRFTSVVRARADDGQPSEVDLTIELLGAVRAPLEDWAQLDAVRRQALQDRFASFGFIRGSSGSGWSDDDLGKVMQCLEQIPDATLASARDVTFERGVGASTAAGEAGRYHIHTPPPTRTITLFDDAFTPDARLRLTVAHEIGHALSGRPNEDNRRRPPRSNTPAYRRAAERDGGLRTGITEYARTSWAEHFAEAYGMYVSEPETHRTLRPRTHAYFETLDADLAGP